MSNEDTTTDTAPGIGTALLGELLKQGVTALITEIISLAISAGKDEAEKFRNGAFTISIAFGGAEGGAQEVLSSIELKLPPE